MKKTLLVFNLTIALISYIAPSRTIQRLADWLVISESLTTASAIIVLLGGESPERIIESERLYQQKLAPQILFGSGYKDRGALALAPPTFSWIDSGARYSLALRSVGVPEDAIRIVNTNDAVDTDAELRNIADYLRANNYSKVILVTSASHTRRVSMIWSRIAPDIESQITHADRKRLDRWWKKNRTIREVSYEYGALAKEMVRRIFG